MDFRRMGQWDSHNIPFLDLPGFGLRMEFHVDFPADEAVSGHAIGTCRPVKCGSALSNGALRVRSARSHRLSFPRSCVMPICSSESPASGATRPWGQREAAPFRARSNQFSFGELSERASQ
jgi:hypothetical protein